MDQWWSWALGIIGLIGFHLAGQKVWWCWYINIANQILWLAYSLVTGQYGFLVATFGYMYVFVRNAIKWTKDHRENNRTPFCLNCPDHEACATGYPCSVVKELASPKPALDSFDGFDIHANYPFRWTFTVDALDFPDPTEFQNFIEYKGRIWIESLPEEYKNNPYYSFSKFMEDDFTAPSKQKITFEVSRTPR